MSTQAEPGSHALGELTRRFKKGFTLEPAGRTSKFRILDPKGEPVKEPGGTRELRLPNTPRSTHVERYRTRLMQAGVIDARSDRAGRRSRNGKSPTDVHARDAHRAAVAVRSQKRQEAINRIYDRLAPFMQKVGGFELEGIQSDLAAAAIAVAREAGGASDITPDTAKNSAHRLVRKQPVEERYLALWSGLADALESQEDPIAWWFLQLRRARGLDDAIGNVEIVVEDQGEWPFRVELVPIEATVVDHDFQRPPPWAFVRKLAATFDPRLVGTIDVSERRHGAVYSILDGQLRTEAMKMLGKRTVWAAIYSGMDQQSEARFFLHKNRDRKAIHPYYTFMARVVAGDEEAKEIKRIVEELGFKLAIGAPRTAATASTNLAAISSLVEVYNRKSEHRSDSLSPTLELLRETTLGRDHGMSGALIRAVGRVVAAYPDSELDWAQLARVLTDRSPAYLIGRARDRGGSSIAAALARVIVGEYNDAKKRGQKLSLSALDSR